MVVVGEDGLAMLPDPEIKVHSPVPGKMALLAAMVTLCGTTGLKQID